MQTQKKSNDPIQANNTQIKNIYLARQPIFDKNINVTGYEILFRSGFENEYDAMQDGDSATSTTLVNSFVHFGIDTITSGKPAFINFTKNLILDGTADIFPRELLAVEVLENIVPDNDLISACRRMKRRGYTIALDDFSLTPETEPLVEIADIVKIDFRTGNSGSRAETIRRIANNRVRFLAEKVETEEEFAEAKNQGFTLFQGYFFSRPKILEGKKIAGNKLTYLQILAEVNDPDASFESLEHIVKRDIALTYKLLRFINSAAFGFRVKITSIRQALTLLGLVEFRKWSSLLVLSSMGGDKPEELFTVTMMRAKFCEFLASKTPRKDRSDNFFLLGMLSNIDAYLDADMSGIVEKLPLDDAIKSALCGEEGFLGNILRSVIAYEKGEWDEWYVYLEKTGIDGGTFPEIYANCIDWVNKIR
jgi:EAL and modified HD-GYP domain-containing signal transduction protein